MGLRLRVRGFEAGLAGGSGSGAATGSGAAAASGCAAVVFSARGRRLRRDVEFRLISVWRALVRRWRFQAGELLQLTDILFNPHRIQCFTAMFQPALLLTMIEGSRKITGTIAEQQRQNKL